MTPRQSALLAVGHFGLVLLALLVLCLSGCAAHLEPDGHGGTYVSPGALLWTVAILWALGRWGSK